MEKSIKTRVMDFVAANGGITTFREVQKFIVEEINGGKWTNERRGFFSSAFSSEGGGRYRDRDLGYFRKPGREKRYLEKQPNGKYHLVNL
jgi:hypothetical protein